MKDPMPEAAPDQSNSKKEDVLVITLKNHDMGAFIDEARIKNMKKLVYEATLNSEMDNNNKEPGVLVEQKMKIDRIPLLQMKLDGTFGDLLVTTRRIDSENLIEPDNIFGDLLRENNKIDPEVLYKTLGANNLWVLDARAGLEKETQFAKLFLNGGVIALAQISNSTANHFDSIASTPLQDPDDYFSDDYVRLGWIVSAGAEIPLFGKKSRFLQDEDSNWKLRLEGSYVSFGGRDCGLGGPNKPCSYSMDNEFGIVRFSLTRYFDLW